MESASQMKDALEKQMEQHREIHQKQLTELRQEIADKQARIDELSEYVFTADFVSVNGTVAVMTVISKIKTNKFSTGS
jgi:predicted RNase H-like nuclease (RuvC/YqgF family)